MQLLIIGGLAGQKEIEQAAEKLGITVIKLLNTTETIPMVKGHMGMLRPQDPEAITRRLTREERELGTMDMSNVIGIIIGTQAPQGKTRFWVTNKLNAERALIPIVVVEDPKDLREVTGYYRGPDHTTLLSQVQEIRVSRIHIVAPERKEDVPGLLRTFITLCHARASSAS